MGEKSVVMFYSIYPASTIWRNRGDSLFNLTVSDNFWLFWLDISSLQKMIINKYFQPKKSSQYRFLEIFTFSKRAMLKDSQIGETFWRTFCEAIGTPKRGDPSLECNGFLRFTSGLTPAEILMTEPYWPMYFFKQRWDSNWRSSVRQCVLQSFEPLPLRETWKTQ